MNYIIYIIGLVVVILGRGVISGIPLTLRPGCRPMRNTPSISEKCHFRTCELSIGHDSLSLEGSFTLQRRMGC
jgi:uncharacterized protein YneF (UPF0154 family)